MFDGFRDFKAEQSKQKANKILRLTLQFTVFHIVDEQENGDLPSTSSASKYRRLEDLFRPPIDILFKGDFFEVN